MQSMILQRVFFTRQIMCELYACNALMYRTNTIDYYWKRFFSYEFKTKIKIEKRNSYCERFLDGQQFGALL